MKNKPLFSLLPLFTGVMLLIASVTSYAATLEYKLSWVESEGLYEVWMRPAETPRPDINLSGQVTLKVPTQARFRVLNLVSTIEGTNWVETSRVDAPEEDPDSDYISLSFIGVQGEAISGYQWQAGEEKLVFSFNSDSGCVEGVSIMENDDPFNQEPNSAGTNPGNQFTNLGWGSVASNNFKGTYGEPISCIK